MLTSQSDILQQSEKQYSTLLALPRSASVVLTWYTRLLGVFYVVLVFNYNKNKKSKTYVLWYNRVYITKAHISFLPLLSQRCTEFLERLVYYR